MRPRRVTWIQTKREGVYKLRRSQTGHVQIGLSCKVSKCSDTGNGALGVLITHETSLMQATITRTFIIESSTHSVFIQRGGGEDVYQAFFVTDRLTNATSNVGKLRQEHLYP